MITKRQKQVKRGFDIIISLMLLLFLFWFIVLLVLITALHCKSTGVFIQNRVGQYGKLFRMYKIQSMSNNKITKWGRFLRDTKLDELPQLYNVLIGDMSLVGPRPDISGYADVLEGSDRIILLIKPGITGPASITFRNEEELLKKQKDALKYNDAVIWPQKVILNKNYVNNYSFSKDLRYIFWTVFPKLYKGYF